MGIENDPYIRSFVAGHFHETPAYWISRPHGASSWLLIVTVAGLGRVGEGWLDPGEAALLAPHHPHVYRASEEGWELRWAHFHPRPDWGPLLNWTETAPGLRRTKLGEEYEPVVQALETAQIHSARATDAYEERLGFAALETALVRIRRAAAVAFPAGDRRLERAIRFALRHLSEPIGPLQMADEAGLSPSRLGALFRNEIGESPRAFLERQRLIRARSLLAMTDLPVKAVAAEVGFASEFYFANRFRRLVGSSPTEYRTSSRT